MIKIGIVGYGNLGKACESISYESSEFELVGIFTRREASSLRSPYDSNFYSQDELFSKTFDIDVLLLCLGSYSDLTDTALRIASKYNSVDSFDTHNVMSVYATKMNKIALENDRLNYIGIGWDPGIFSLMRALFDNVCNGSKSQTFWGKGVSQGHSEAIRKIQGVKYAVQYTIPKESAIMLAREGKASQLLAKDKHLRECFVVINDDVDKAKITNEIVNMPNYFADYETIVHFIDEDEFLKNHTNFMHGGIVLKKGDCCGNGAQLEFGLKLDSNPHFTASVLMAYVRANYLNYKKGDRGAKTIIDIVPSSLIKGEWKDIIDCYV